MQPADLHNATVRSATVATNEGNLDAYLALFAPDATVTDGAIYRGLQEIRRWAEREIFGVQLRFHVERETNVEGTTVEGRVQTHGGYNGRATLSYTLRGNLIENLVIQ